MDTVRCFRCREYKSPLSFSKSLSVKRSLQGWCKECRSIHSKAKHTKLNAYRAEASSRTEKPCTKCGRTKALIEFYRDSKSLDGVTCACRMCLKQLVRSRRATIGTKETVESRATRLQESKRKRQALKLEAINLLGGSCSSCGLSPSESVPVNCFDFHHKGDKLQEIGLLLSRYSKKNAASLLAEVEKCIVLCANCHRKAHA